MRYRFTWSRVGAVFGAFLFGMAVYLILNRAKVQDAFARRADDLRGPTVEAERVEVRSSQKLHHDLHS